MIPPIELLLCDTRSTKRGEEKNSTVEKTQSRRLLGAPLDSVRAIDFLCVLLDMMMMMLLTVCLPCVRRGNK